MTAMTDDTLPVTPRAIRDEMIVFVVMAALLAIVPLTGIYPFFVMQALCFALLACAFNLLIGYGGLLSFGHAMFLGTAGYVTAHALKVWGLTPELGILVGTVGAAGAWRHHRPGRHPPPGHLLLDDHAGAVAAACISSICRRRSPTAKTASRAFRKGYLFGIFNLAKPTMLYYVILVGFLPASC